MHDKSAQTPHTRPEVLPQLDAAGLAEALRSRRVRGEVRFDHGARALYATDGSNYRQVPIGVVLPHDADDVLAAISALPRIRRPLLCRGGRHIPRRAMLQRRRHPRLLQVHVPHPRNRSRAPHRPRAARRRPRHTSATPPKNITSPSPPIPPATTAAPSAA